MLGVIVFVGAGDIPVAIVFIGLSLIYLTESPTRFGVFPASGRLVALWQVLTGLWLMYLTWAFTLNLSLNMHLWVYVECRSICKKRPESANESGSCRL